MAYRAEVGAGVVLGDHHHGGGQAEADQRGEVERHDAVLAIVTHDHAGDRVEGNGGEYARDNQPAVQRIHDLATFTRLDEEGADN